MSETSFVSKIQTVVEQVKEVVKRFIVPEEKYDEDARVYRCKMASEQALKDLESIKSGARGDSHRQGFIR